MVIKTLVFVIGVIISLSSPCFAGTYYTSPAGGWTWAQSEGNPAQPCTLALANTNASAGDVVYMTSGTYNTQIAPTNSGTTGSPITYQAYPGSTPLIENTGANNNGIFLDGKAWIKIDGIAIGQVTRWANIRNWANCNEITNCSFTSTTGYMNGKGFHIWGQCTGGAVYTCPSTQNWVHNNTFYKNGWITGGCDDEGANMYIGGASAGDNTSSYNTIEDNVFYSGGHHLIETTSSFNVIRNNVFHNEGWMDGSCTWGPSPRNGKYGNRCIQIYDGFNAGDLRNVIEGNRIGHAAFSPDGGMDGNLTITSQGNVIRYNKIFYSETTGLYFKAGAGSVGFNNRVYNNTIYANGIDSQIYPDAWTGFGDLDYRAGVFFNASGVSSNVVKGNIIHGNYVDVKSIVTAYNTVSDNWLTTNGDPKLIGTSVADPTSTTQPALSLAYNSSCRDGGVALTTANGAGVATSTLVVIDAHYFSAGYGSLLTGTSDWVAVGTVSNVAQIANVDTGVSTITLATPLSWEDGASVWLYKKSDGVRVLYGSAPDIGADEYNVDLWEGTAKQLSPGSRPITSGTKPMRGL